MHVTDGRMHVKTIKNIELLHGSRSVNEYGGDRDERTGKAARIILCAI